MPVEISYTISDAKLVEVKPSKRNRKILAKTREGAPPPPAGRFSYTYTFKVCDAYGKLLELHGGRFDGNLVVYNHTLDAVSWVPARTFYGNSYKNINHLFETTRQYVAKSLGFPEFNPGWDTGVSPAGAQRVKDGLYMQVLDAARLWRKEWLVEDVTAARVEEKTLASEITSYIDGKD